MVGFKAAVNLIIKALTTKAMINWLGDQITGWTKNKIDDEIWDLKKAIESGDIEKVQKELQELGLAVKLEWMESKSDT